MKYGTIVQVSGPVVDVRFSGETLPKIREALWVLVSGEKRVMEVAQHIGNAMVRCIMLAASEGLCRGMQVCAEGKPLRYRWAKQRWGVCSMYWAM